MDHLIEISGYDEVGYDRVIEFDTWTVAMLNYIDELESENIDNFQAHLETDEVFVLLEGRCILYLAEVTSNHISNIKAIDMKPNKMYNIKKGAYHTHTLTEGAKVLIVENSNTSDDNSPKIMIEKDINQELVRLRNDLWNN